MRKVKFTFFLILVVLTAVLMFIIIGEDKQYNDPADVSLLVDDGKATILDKSAMINKYQNVLSDILYEYQQMILQQSISREAAIVEIREKILAMTQIPADMQSLHLQIALALSRDLSGYTSEAVLVYKELQSQYSWLFSRFNFLFE